MDASPFCYASPTAIDQLPLRISHEGSFKFGKPVYSPPEKEETCGHLIAQIFSNLPKQSVNEARLGSLKETIRHLHQHKAHPSASLDETESHSSSLFKLYEFLSLDPICKESKPHLASLQAHLVYSSMSSEFERFRRSFARLAPTQAPPSAPDRYFSQVSFYSYLHSEEGSSALDQLSEKMSGREIAVFNQAVNFLESFLPNYLKILSYIETAKKHFEDHPDRPEDDFKANLEFRLQNLLLSIAQENSDFMIPLGWSLDEPEGQRRLGHHIFCLIENPGSSDEAVVKIFDTALRTSFDTALRTPQEFDSKPISIDIAACEHANPQSVKTAEKCSLEEPYPLSQKRCSSEFLIKGLSSKIQHLAKLLMLQIPSYTNRFIKLLEKRTGVSHDQPLIEEKLTAIIYSITKSSPSTPCSPPSALEKWNIYPVNACTSFQPLLQYLVLKAAKFQHIDLSEQEEINLRGYCELLQQSYKLFLIENFKEQLGNPTVENLFRDILHHTMTESENAIIEHSDP